MTLHRQEDREGKPASRDYRYSGRFRSRQLTLLWEAVDRPDYRIGAMVLHLSEAGTQFQGLTIFYDDTFHGVGSVEYWLRREGS